MTLHGCPSEEALGEVASLPATDPLRIHSEDCPRCCALLAGSAEFESAMRETVSEGSPGTLRVPHPAPSFRQRLWAPTMRPAWALAALALLLGGYLYWPQLAMLGSAIRARRSETPSEIEWAAAIEYRAGGGVHLSWKAVPEAERYEVRLYGESFEELDRIGAGGETAQLLPPDRMPQAYRDGGTILYRIYALRGADEIRTSTAGLLAKP